MNFRPRQIFIIVIILFTGLFFLQDELILQDDLICVVWLFSVKNILKDNWKIEGYCHHSIQICDRSSKSPLAPRHVHYRPSNLTPAYHIPAPKSGARSLASNIRPPVFEKTPFSKTKDTIRSNSLRGAQKHHFQPSARIEGHLNQVPENYFFTGLISKIFIIIIIYFFTG